MSEARADAAMDAIYRWQTGIYDITRRFYLLGRDRLIEDLAVPPGGRVLEVACGTGRNLLRIAQRYPQARLYGLDISHEMLAQAQKSVRRAGREGDITLAHGDACAFDPGALFEAPQMERIVYSYCLSMIPAWETALEAVVPHLAPGGAIHVVDFGDHARLPGWVRAAQFAWLAHNHVTPRTDLPQVVTRIAEAHGLEAQVETTHRGYAVLATLRR